MHHHMSDEHKHHKRGTRGGFFERGGIILVILDLLQGQPRHGYDIIRELEERSAGFYSPSPGVVYPTLQSLEDRDFVTSVTEEGGKKVYSITEAGAAWLESHEEHAKRSREHLASCGGGKGAGDWPGAMQEMKWFFDDVARAVRRTCSDPEKMREIREVVRDAKKKIDEIVARQTDE